MEIKKEALVKLEVLTISKAVFTQTRMPKWDELIAMKGQLKGIGRVRVEGDWVLIQVGDNYYHIRTNEYIQLTTDARGVAEWNMAYAKLEKDLPQIFVK